MALASAPPAASRRVVASFGVTDQGAPTPGPRPPEHRGRLIAAGVIAAVLLIAGVDGRLGSLGSMAMRRWPPAPRRHRCLGAPPRSPSPRPPPRPRPRRPRPPPPHRPGPASMTLAFAGDLLPHMPLNAQAARYATRRGAVRLPADARPDEARARAGRRRHLPHGGPGLARPGRRSRATRRSARADRARRRGQGQRATTGARPPRTTASTGAATASPPRSTGSTRRACATPGPPARRRRARHHVLRRRRRQGRPPQLRLRLQRLPSSRPMPRSPSTRSTRAASAPTPNAPGRSVLTSWS